MKLIFIIGLMLLLLTACKEDIVNQGELLYRNSQDLSGEWHQESYPERSRFILINEGNIDQFKGDLRGLRDINFDGKLGVYVTLGERPTGGYAINIRQIRRRKDDLIVVLKAVGPGPDDMVTQAITNPHHIVKLSEDIIEGVDRVVFVSEEGDILNEKDYNLY